MEIKNIAIRHKSITECILKVEIVFASDHFVDANLRELSVAAYGLFDIRKTNCRVPGSYLC